MSVHVTTSKKRHSTSLALNVVLGFKCQYTLLHYYESAHGLPAWLTTHTSHTQTREVYYSDWYWYHQHHTTSLLERERRRHTHHRMLWWCRPASYVSQAASRIQPASGQLANGLLMLICATNTTELISSVLYNKTVTMIHMLFLWRRRRILNIQHYDVTDIDW